MPWKLVVPEEETARPVEQSREDRELELRRDIGSILNKHCAENVSNTPDFILARYLQDCLKAFDQAVVFRSAWYGRNDELGQPDQARRRAEP